MDSLKFAEKVNQFEKVVLNNQYIQNLQKFINKEKENKINYYELITTTGNSANNNSFFPTNEIDNFVNLTTFENANVIDIKQKETVKIAINEVKHKIMCESILDKQKEMQSFTNKSENLHVIVNFD